MQVFITYIKDYLRNTDTVLLLFSAAFAAVLVWLNYRFGLETKILYGISNRLQRFGGFYLLYIIAFATPYLLKYIITGQGMNEPKLFVAMLLLAPAIFAAKVSVISLGEWITQYKPGPWWRYTGIVTNLPSRFLLMLAMLIFVWWLGKYPRPFFGMTAQGFNWYPYLLMLLVMLPLLAFAASRPDFQATYPKLKQIEFIIPATKYPWLYRLLYEISYGLDFLSIELFFRGFLVLAFVRFAGTDAILPMAVFYCSIHFGKPMLECISSFFGGLLLGIVVYHTRSIYGGLVVHLGIAWLMEAGGWIGNYLKK